MARVVRKKIQQNKTGFTSIDNQAILVATSWCQAKWTLISWRLLPVLNVDQTVRSPKALKIIRYPW
jgi:hypothetical protein